MASGARVRLGPAAWTRRGDGIAIHSRTLLATVQPMCSTMTARLNAALVAVGTVVGLVMVSDGAQKPPIQYQDCAMICCNRSTGSRVTIATSSTTATIESRGATS